MFLTILPSSAILLFAASDAPLLSFIFSTQPSLDFFHIIISRNRTYPRNPLVLLCLAFLPLYSITSGSMIRRGWRLNPIAPRPKSTLEIPDAVYAPRAAILPQPRKTTDDPVETRDRSSKGAFDDFFRRFSSLGEIITCIRNIQDTRSSRPSNVILFLTFRMRGEEEGGEGCARERGRNSSSACMLIHVIHESRDAF